MNYGNEKRKPSRLLERIGQLVARGQYRKALDLIDAVIEDPLPLFEGEAWVIEERRMAWQYRIDLLRDMGRFTEALAWACLEAEMNPDNVTAQALKSQLKRQAGLVRRRPEPGAPKPSGSSFWDGVAGMRALKAMLERDVILPLQEPELYAKYRLTLPNGILLYGPPGCGKTFIARKLARILGFTFKEIKPGDLASIYVHGTQGMIAELFAAAVKQAPCMLFFDEIDAMVPSRDGGSVGHHYASEVNEFLAQLNECNRKRVLVVGATNLPGRIDSAILRPGRLDKKFLVGPPDYEARVELLKMAMKDRPQSGMNWPLCANETEYYSCAEIDHLVNEAARRALSDHRPITTDDILHAAGSNPSALSPDEIQEMQKLLGDV